ncbi:hypothetical protein GS597_20135, partial [Synechococcales cyanobacterium C]
MSNLAIVEAFRDLPDTRREAGRRHELALCLALFTLAVIAGCRGFLAMGDWLNKIKNLRFYRRFETEAPQRGIRNYSGLKESLFFENHRG